MKDDKFADEMLDDEELDVVSGGGSRQIAGDNEFLGMMTGMYHKGISTEDESKVITQGWAKFGIRVDTHINEMWSNLMSSNYYIGDKEISRMDAFKHAMKQKGWSDAQIASFDWDGVKGSW